MEKRYEYINDEFYKLVKQEAQQVFNGNDIDIVIERYNKIEADDSLSLEEVLNCYKSDEQLCKLSKSISLISAINKFLELDTDDIINSLDDEIIVIQNNIENYDNKKLWILIWLFLQKKKIDNKRYSNKELAQFYVKLFNSYYINIVKEFIGELGIIRNSIFFKDEYLYILQDAVNKYPQINAFRSFLMFVYLSTKNYKKYIPLINSDIEKMEVVDIHNSIGIIDTYLNLLSYRLIAYSKLDMITESLNDIIKIQSLLPNIETLNYSEKPSRDKAYFAHYRQCVLTSLSINLKQENNNFLEKDLDFIKKYMSSENFDSWVDYYPNAIEYIQNNKVK